MYQLVPSTDSVGRSTTLTSRSKLGREDIKWQELLVHFRTVQAKHEKARRQGTDLSNFSGSAENALGARPGLAGPAMRRKVTGDVVPALNANPSPGTSSGTSVVPSRMGALSPLNPRARTQAGLLSPALPGGNSPAPGSPPSSAAMAAAAQKQKRAYSLNRKA
jgi:vacuole morphology and inheritance protein 14